MWSSLRNRISISKLIYQFQVSSYKNEKSCFPLLLSLFILIFFSSLSRLALWNIYWLFLSFYFRETCCLYFLQLNLFRDYQVMRRNYFFHWTLDLCFSFLLCLFWPFFSFNFFYPCFWSYHRHMKSIGFIASTSTRLVFNFMSCYIVFKLLDLSRNFRLLVVKDFSFALLFSHFSFFLNTIAFFLCRWRSFVFMS